MKKIITAILLPLSIGVTHAQTPADQTRLDQVVERGAKVMPFNLDKTLHIFDKNETGGVQRVIVKDASDTEQINLIRRHLSEIAGRFAQGDFSGPRRIHGDDMPGVKELSSASKQMYFEYRDLPNGGQIDYRSDDSQLVDAVHRYFDAQLSDHARHAAPGGHQMHHAQPQ